MGESRVVQGQPEPRLAAVERLVARHRATTFDRPIENVSQPMCEAIGAALHDAVAAGRQVVVDLGCGTGESTFAHAQRLPGAWVLGVDKSAQRLARAGAQETCSSTGAPWIVRVNSIDVAASLIAKGVPIDELWLLYPNPWPKSQHLGRRWYGHPLFPGLIALARRVECRTNWEVYAREFARALQCLGRDASCEPWNPLTAGNPPLTAFERKYALSGHTLWRVATS